MQKIAVPGRCRCGHSQFVLREEPISFYLCHCTQCQAESGSAFGQTMHVRNEAIDSAEGPLREHTVEGPEGQRIRLTYCGDCLTNLWGQNVDIPQVRGVNAGSLEDAAGLEPYGNMWTRSARPWVSFAPGPRFEQHPPDRLAMIRAWQERPQTAD
ncbi:MAG: GFA family protein [Myxococcota bacterium]